jgi:SOS response regulatory protein OraA/RecX
MNDETLSEISKKLNVLISLSLRKLLDDKEFVETGKRKQGVGDLTHYLADMGLDAKDIAEILGSPLQSVRTLLTPKRRK